MPTLNWIGKEKVISHHRDVPFKILEHKYSFSEKGESPNPIDSGNKIIHGDNLEALKSLLPEYEGMIKCIYIDPPYNTGNENWVYNDNVNHPKIQRWLETTLKAKENDKEAAIGIDDLARHDKWLCMMYPRLQLLHKLLASDGVIFISIDDNEAAHLKLVLDEIFGSFNFLSNIIWNSRKSVSNDAIVSLNHNHTFVYVKHADSFKTVKSGFKLKINSSHFSNPDNDSRGPWAADPFDSPGIRPNLTYEIINPNTGDKYMPPKGRCWRTGPSEYQKLLKEQRIVFGKTGKSKPQLKRFLADADEKGKTPTSIWDDVGTATNATKELQEIFGEKRFETPKPVSFIEKILELSTKEDSLVLDSFAGSSTTAHATLNLNKKDGGNRKFILIEMEEYAEKITAERIKRVIRGYSDKEGTGGNFNFYELGKPLFVGEHNEYLNEEIETEKIREYIWYSETRAAYKKPRPGKDSPYFLGKREDAGYYFIYEKKQSTTLDYDSLATIKIKSGQYVIYADNCLLPKDFMLKNNIVFKKIPRDISRF